MTRFMLDTDVCIRLLRDGSGKDIARTKRWRFEEVAISIITLAELQYGASKSARPGYHRLLIARFCAPLAILEFDHAAAERYGTVRAELERRGTPIGPLDTLIASHALSENLTLITGNRREFERVTGLRLTSWA